MSTQNSSFYALLMGINYYSQNRLSDGSSYKSLKGCVRDINQVEDFLKKLPTRPNKIVKLTASNPENNSPVEPPEQLPTYKNIIKSFQHITQIAKPGDRIYIHYSGHGGRAKTIYPEYKGESGQDETLVPTDIGSENGRYLRDLEFAYLLQQMVDKKLQVTVVLDSCHSGGAVRGGEDENVRGSGVVDNTVRPQDSLVASSEEIIKNWQNITGKTSDPAGNRTGTLLAKVKGYVLLAACQHYEAAYEYAFDGKERNGVLTHWLLKTLTPDPSKLMITYQMLQDYIKPNINKLFRQQTPMLIGEGDRLIFGWESIPSEYTANVTDIKIGKKQRIELNVGELQGLERGAEFTLYPFGTTAFSTKQQLALIKLVEVEGSTSWGEVQTVFSEQPIKVGDLAMLTLVSSNLIRKVYLLENDTLPKEINQRAALQKIESSTRIFKNAWIEFVDEVEKADYLVRVAILDAEKAEQYQAKVNDVIYEVCDRTQTPIILRPALKVNEITLASPLIQRLVHLAKYQAVYNLKNHDPRSEMLKKIAVRLTTKPDQNQELNAGENPTEITITENQTYSLEIQNHYSQPVYVAVFNLQQNWAISSVLPETPGRGIVISLEPKQKETIPLPNLEKKENWQNIYKVCVSVDDTNFRFLELPPLAQQKQPVRDNPKNFLEQLLQEMTAEQPPDRNVTPAPLPSSKWTVVQFTVN
ncbi:caspase family protein [Limnoraphis robusta Tam1]|uniref:caspase family protein n=1 Tax=Limnoraphis robusta TaxID=1118279 RepID=UPI002B1F5827|nr:caspase family protein [Limnoraphis robusta]MEA5499120.1 caspase family protein [Limnoraphis robusta BA-68 BA1]MEA5537617.1 caspase family protein [Limnoraphis robusta Tam1]